jgi:dihydrofolate reductase
VSKVRVSFSISVDGFGAGINQSADDPIGVGGLAMHQWAFATRTFQTMHGGDGGSTGVADDFAQRSFTNVGAWILGRNMFSPLRGPWLDDSWKGWWGDSPPYHVPVFVLTNHARESIVMQGGTTFHFVTEGIEVALERAREAADGMDVRIGGGVSTIRQYLQANLIDEMHLVVSPLLLGAGEALFTGIDTASLGFRCTEHVPLPDATHYVFTR